MNFTIFLFFNIHTSLAKRTPPYIHYNSLIQPNYGRITSCFHSVMKIDYATMILLIIYTSQLVLEIHFGLLRLVPSRGQICGDTEGYISVYLGLFVRDSRIRVGGLYMFLHSSARYFLLRKQDTRSTNFFGIG